MKKFIPLIIFILLLIAALSFFRYMIQSKKPVSVAPTNTLGTTTEKPSPTEESHPTIDATPTKTMPEQLQPPALTIDKNKQYTAILTTSAGTISILLAADKTPVTANNFIYLAQKHFYDNTVFHRVIKGFMIQGGDPTGTGAGGPGYQFNDEPFVGDYTRGTVAMANAGPNTNGSQFFIMHGDNQLPKNYVIFGRVISGIDIVDAIAAAPVAAGSSGENSKPVTPVTVKSVEIQER